MPYGSNTVASHPLAHKGPPAAIMVAHDFRPALCAHEQTTSVQHVLTYLAAGWLHMVHGSEVRVPAGSVTVVPAGVPHRALSGRNVELWQVRFCASCLQLDEGQLLMSPFRAARRGAFPVVAIAESSRPLLVQRLAELAHENDRPTAEAPQLCHALLMLILGEVHRSMGSLAAEGFQGSLVGDALEFIQRHCFEAVSLKDVAAAVHRSAAHVATSVKSATGYSVGSWILSGRISEAAARLLHTDERIDEIGRRVGWQDETHFIRQFKKQCGVTPATWRRQNRAQHAIGQ